MFLFIIRLIDSAPTESPTGGPTNAPTPPTDAPTKGPTESPTGGPTVAPTPPTNAPTTAPTRYVVSALCSVVLCVFALCVPFSSFSALCECFVSVALFLVV
jgi:hypothetical protein